MNNQITSQSLQGQVNVNKVETSSNTSSSNVSAPKARLLPKKVNDNPKYTENWINIKKIGNGIIYNDTGEMITGVKVQPKNIFILDNSTMDNTLVGLMNFYNTLDFEFWLIVADRPVDINVYEAELQLLYNNNQNPMIRKVIAQDMKKGELFKNNDVVDTEYYILFKEKKADILEKRIRNMINGLASCGMISSQTSNDDLRMIINNFLNAGRDYENGTVMPI